MSDFVDGLSGLTLLSPPRSAYLFPLSEEGLPTLPNQDLDCLSPLRSAYLLHLSDQRSAYLDHLLAELSSSYLIRLGLNDCSLLGSLDGDSVFPSSDLILTKRDGPRSFVLPKRPPLLPKRPPLPDHHLLSSFLSTSLPSASICLILSLFLLSIN